MHLLSQMILAQNDFGGDGGGEGGAIFLVSPIIGLVFLVVMLAGAWKTFAKAGKPGWACIIPIYNVIVMCEIAGRPLWWALVISFIPCVIPIMGLILMIDFAKSYGKGAGFGIGLLLLGFIFYPMLGFGDAKYIGPAAATAE